MNCYSSAASCQILICSQAEFDELQALLRREDQPFDAGGFDASEIEEGVSHGFDLDYISDKDASGVKYFGAFLYADEENCQPYALPVDFLKRVGEILGAAGYHSWVVGVALTADKTRPNVYGGYDFEITKDGRVVRDAEFVVDWKPVSIHHKIAEVRVHGMAFTMQAIRMGADGKSPTDRGLSYVTTRVLEMTPDRKGARKYVPMDDHLWLVVMLPAFEDAPNVLQ